VCPGLRTSMAVLMVWILTANGSQMPYSFMSTSWPDSPLMPHVLSLPDECLACHTHTGRLSVNMLLRDPLLMI
jgi:hypothetical protein